MSIVFSVYFECKIVSNLMLLSLLLVKLLAYSLIIKGTSGFTSNTLNVSQGAVGGALL